MAREFDNENTPEHTVPPDTEPARQDPDLALERIKPEMRVLDRSGEEIGAVVKVYRPAGVGTVHAFAEDAFMRVGDRGLFGLGGDIYVPVNVVKRVDPAGGTVVIDVEKDMIGDMAWDRPERLPEK